MRGIMYVCTQPTNLKEKKIQKKMFGIYFIIFYRVRQQFTNASGIVVNYISLDNKV